MKYSSKPKTSISVVSLISHNRLLLLYSWDFCLPNYSRTKVYHWRHFARHLPSPGHYTHCRSTKFWPRRHHKPLKLWMPRPSFPRSHYLPPLLREGFKIQKKKSMTFVILGLDPPPPQKNNACAKISKCTTFAEISAPTKPQK